MWERKKTVSIPRNWDYLISIPKNTQILGNSIMSFNMNKPLRY